MMTKNQMRNVLQVTLFVTGAVWGYGSHGVASEEKLPSDEKMVDQESVKTMPQEPSTDQQEIKPFEMMEMPQAEKPLTQAQKDSMTPFSILQDQTKNSAATTNFSESAQNQAKADAFMVGTMDMLNQPAPEMSMMDKVLSFVKDSLKNIGAKIVSWVPYTDVWSPLGQAATEKLDRIEDDKRIQKEVIADLVDRIANNPVDRAAIDELMHLNMVKENVNAFAMITHQLDDPLVIIHFYNTGFFDRIEELAMGSEYVKLGYFEEIPEGVLDSKKNRAVRKYLMMTTSPAEEKLKYYMYARVGID